MKRKLLTSGLWAASIIIAATSTAYAAAQITSAQIKDGTVTSIDIKNGGVGYTDLSRGAKQTLIKAAGRATPASANAGTSGAAGKDGVDGKDGVNGVNAPSDEYGIAHVWLKRGANAPSVWGSYSTLVPSVGGIPGTAGGEFRATCNQPTCELYVTASVVSDRSSANAKLQAHIQVTRTADANLVEGGLQYCEASEIGSLGAPLAIPRVAPASSSFLDSILAPAPRVNQAWSSADCDNNGADANNGATSGTKYILKPGRYNIDVTARFYA